MKIKIALALFISAGLFACSPSSQIVNSWKDPNTSVQTPSAHKIVVAALIQNQVVRRQVEDYMTSLYPGSATQSYLAFGTDSLITNEEADNKLLKDKLYDGIVIMRQANQSTTQRYTPGTSTSFNYGWGGYWGRGWGRGWGMNYSTPITPGQITTEQNWIVEINAFSVQENKLVWTANSRTITGTGSTAQYKKICNDAVQKMKSDGFLK